MPFKINIGTEKGKTWKLETDSQALVGKNLQDKIKGEDVSADLAGYEFEISGASDKSGFPSLENIDGIGLKKVFLTYGKSMHRRPKKEGKKKHATMKPKGLRLRKTVRGKTISESTSQINLKLLKSGNKKLEEIFPDQAPKLAEPEKKPEIKETKKEPEQKQEIVEEKEEVKSE